MLKLFFYTLLVFLQLPVIQDVDKSYVIELIKNDISIIDLRTEEEFSEGNIDKSINLDFLKREFIDKLETLDKEKPFLIYCMSGNRSSKASHVMKSLGFKIIYNYKDGYKDWIED